MKGLKVADFAQRGICVSKYKSGLASRDATEIMELIIQLKGLKVADFAQRGLKVKDFAQRGDATGITELIIPFERAQSRRLCAARYMC
ncbi:hypothetical protein EI546_13640 [Aequorivita sp. H23M31]|uniref:Uncharacterized protein n=1 Tax=Aequorivita ciconiae TaxID=2494375 RepID=A0A410G5Z2_9FLAO|nr:hypothetical protein [Aequorivita sp. H23M31]QAA82697.1 hypothetical protein EI546_13640 [Aequorivita sp. H23M31]